MYHHRKTILTLLFLTYFGYGALLAQDYLPTAYPDRVTLAITADPSTQQAVSWRTDQHSLQGLVEIKLEDRDPKMESHVQQIPAISSVLKVTSPQPREDYYHQANINDLSPNTVYAYRVGDGKHWSEWYQFRTAPAQHSTDTFSFIYMGDAQNDLKSKWSRAIRRAFQYCPQAAFIVHSGDLINRSNTDPEWGEWHYGTGFIHGMIPAVPTPGNHDHTWNDQTDRPELDPHWSKQFLLPTNGPKGLETSVYYTDYQQVRLISLNSQIILHDAQAREAQAEWLEKILQDNPKKWTIVIQHHPIYSTSKRRDNEVLSQRFEPLFDKYGVDLVLQGHDHTYARGKGKTANSPTYVVSVAGPKMYNSDSDRWMDVSYENMQTYQIIDCASGALRYRSYDLSGQVVDEFSLKK